MDESRRQNGPSPALAVRERGNYISVRQKPDQTGGWGTLNRPKQFEMPWLGRHSLHTSLGYEAMPSSEVWAFATPRGLQLQVTRRSDDAMANCVAVALLDDNNRHVAPLVATAGGVGEPVTVPAGEYRIIASLGVAEMVQIELEVNAQPALALQGRGAVRTVARLLSRSIGQRRFSARSLATAHGRGITALAEQLLAGQGGVRVGGTGWLASHRLQGMAEMALQAVGQLTGDSGVPLVGTAPVGAGGALTIRAVVWRDEPDDLWRVRLVGGVIEVNRAYFGADVALQRQQLAAAL